LPENLLLVTVSVPSLRMAPPKPRPSAPVAWLADNVLLVTVSVPSLRMAPSGAGHAAVLQGQKLQVERRA
jgi:hypothetical protein